MCFISLLLLISLYSPTPSPLMNPDSCSSSAVLTQQDNDWYLFVLKWFENRDNNINTWAMIFMSVLSVICWLLFHRFVYLDRTYLVNVCYVSRLFCHIGLRAAYTHCLHEDRCVWNFLQNEENTEADAKKKCIFGKGEVSFTNKLKMFSKQLTTPAVTLSGLPCRCFHEIFSSLLTEGPCCHDNSTDECVNWETILIHSFALQSALKGSFLSRVCGTWSCDRIWIKFPVTECYLFYG